MGEGHATLRAQRLVDVSAAAFAAVLAFLAVPAALLLIVGDPLSSGLGHGWHPFPRDLMCVLAFAAWVAWAACCAQLLRAVVASVRSGDVRSGRSGSPVDRVASRIAIGVLALTSVGAPLALSAGAGASTPDGQVGATATVSTAWIGPAASPSSSETAAALRATASTPRPPTPGPTHEVAPGETLWSIADSTLGDGAEWMTLAALNLGLDMHDGARFVDPDRLRAGWRLRLPADARREAGRVRQRDAARVRGTEPLKVAAAPAGQPVEHRLPELLALGLGSLACAALARRTAGRRRPRPFTGDQLEPTPTEAAVDAATLVRRFDGVPALDVFEAANRLLGQVLDERARRPAVQAICAGPAGVTFWLARPDAEPPHGFGALENGAGWHVDHQTLNRAPDGATRFVSHAPYVPLAFPVGDDDDGTWLVCLQAGSVLPLLGASAPALWRAGRSAVRCWAWAETVVVTDDPADVAPAPEAPADQSTGRNVLFFGDPNALPEGAARSVAVVTTASVAATGLTILVDQRGATLHPLGRVVRPHLQSPETALAIEELVGSPQARNPEPPRLEHAGVDKPCSAEHGVLTPGPVEVRLLTMTPRLDGLSEELPPNRARRAVELVAYLALHQPDVITSDRLRTRVLGSSDADAAAKTLFNTAYAARRAMGTDQRGELLFPAATRNGLYQLSPKVTVDVQRAAALAAAGTREAESNPEVAMARLQAALDLVEGEPLANSLSGFTWWEAEGHGGRVAAVLADAACTLATLAARAGRFDLAWWGLERARLVEPYSETLARAGMRLAATEGDADRLRLEWRDCQRMVDALDPGSFPSSRTEALYGELSRVVLAAAPQPGRSVDGRVPSAGEGSRRRYVPAGD